MRINIKVHARSKRDSITVQPDGSFKVEVKAPPVDGAANEAICELVASHFKVHKRDVLVVLVNMNDQIMVNSEFLPDVKMLKDKTKEFIANPGNDETLTEKKKVYIQELGSEESVSKGVVSLQNDRGTSYEMYIAVQNQLTAAFNELRDEFSNARFGKPFNNLNNTQRKGVQKVIPINISEAEPVNYGGNK